MAGKSGTSDMPPPTPLISILFAVCAMVIFFQEIKVQLDYLFANFTFMGHEVSGWGKPAGAAAEQVSFTTMLLTCSTWDCSVSFGLELSSWGS